MKTTSEGFVSVQTSVYKNVTQFIELSKKKKFCAVQKNPKTGGVQ